MGDGGDVLVFTKKLGVGVLTTAAKGGLACEGALDAVVESMVTLNKDARDKAGGLRVHAAMDVTGFSLAGHSMQMAQASGVSFQIKVGFAAHLAQEQKDILCDPETSGGLLLALPEEDAKKLPYPVIGRVVGKGALAVEFV